MSTNETVYSFSRLSTFHQCKYEYWLNYLAPEEHRLPNEDNAFNLYGSFCHGLLERWANGELASFEMLPIYEDEFDVQVSEDFPPNNFADLRSTYYNDGWQFFHDFEGFPDKYEIVSAEQEFTVEFERFKLRGFIDLILRDKETGNFVILDWKSKAKFKSKAEQKEYARQTYLYAKYINDSYGVWPEKLVFFHFRKQIMTEIPFKMADYLEAIHWAEKTVDEIEKTENWEVPYTETDAKGASFFCNCLCGFRRNCQYAKKLREEYMDEHAGLE